MPRHERLNYPGCIYHVITRGIERRKLFRDNQDREEFLTRLGKALEETGCECHAWVLMDNHLHLLIRTGDRRAAIKRFDAKSADRLCHLFQPKT